jgi:hypothetical protein
MFDSPMFLAAAVDYLALALVDEANALRIGTSGGLADTPRSGIAALDPVLGRTRGPRFCSVRPAAAVDYLALALVDEANALRIGTSGGLAEAPRCGIAALDPVIGRTRVPTWDRPFCLLPLSMRPAATVDYFTVARIDISKTGPVSASTAWMSDGAPGTVIVSVDPVFRGAMGRGRAARAVGCPRASVQTTGASVVDREVVARLAAVAIGIKAATPNPITGQIGRVVPLVVQLVLGSLFQSVVVDRLGGVLPLPLSEPLHLSLPIGTSLFGDPRGSLCPPFEATLVLPALLTLKGPGNELVTVRGMEVVPRLRRGHSFVDIDDTVSVGRIRNQARSTDVDVEIVNVDPGVSVLTRRAVISDVDIRGVVEASKQHASR